MLINTVTKTITIDFEVGVKELIEQLQNLPLEFKDYKVVSEGQEGYREIQNPYPWSPTVPIQPYYYNPGHTFVGVGQNDLGTLTTTALHTDNCFDTFLGKPCSESVSGIWATEGKLNISGNCIISAEA